LWKILITFDYLEKASIESRSRLKWLWKQAIIAIYHVGTKQSTRCGGPAWRKTCKQNRFCVGLGWQIQRIQHPYINNPKVSLLHKFMQFFIQFSGTCYLWFLIGCKLFWPLSKSLISLMSYNSSSRILHNFLVPPQYYCS